MEKNGNKIFNPSKPVMKYGGYKGSSRGRRYTIVSMILVAVIWFFAARAIGRSLILPDFVETMLAFFGAWVDPYILGNLATTLRRVFTGLLYATMIGFPLGLLTGFFPTLLGAVSPYIDSIRQIPIMAWVPLSIIWFGLGDGPTIFMITMSAVFPILINTIQGVKGIDPNYRFAAESMGASTGQVFMDVIIPGSFASFLIGFRTAIGTAWSSVICAEFIATSSGFGFLMVEAQVRMQTPQLYALMIMSAVVGYSMDRIIVVIEKYSTSWRFKNGTFES